MKSLPINQILHEDCLSFLTSLKDKQIHILLTDPPYGIKEDGSRNHTRSKKAKAKKYKATGWDNERVPSLYIQQMLRTSKKQIIFGGNFFTSDLQDSSCWLVWDKMNGMNDFSDCELAWTNLKTAVRVFRYRRLGYLRTKGYPKEKRYHPTQKPVPLMEWCLKQYNKEKELVLDPFCGSGSTCIAAKRLGISYIGIDSNKEYCDIAKYRLKNTKKVAYLF